MTTHWRPAPLHYLRCAKKVFLQVEDPVTLNGGQQRDPQ